ncbi:MAG: SRPBCC family protein [Gemmatimonadota bacterium]
MSESPFSFGTKFLAAGALLSGLFLLVGFLLPGRWEAHATTVVEAPAEEIRPFLTGAEGWRQWTPWPDTGLVVEGPPAGPGSAMRWDHPEYGDGVFRIVDTLPPRVVRYEVAVQDSALLTRGTLTLNGEGGRTTVTWDEEGDFGWNPLMGYWALLMGKSQSRELQKDLDALARLAAGKAARADPQPAER